MGKYLNKFKRGKDRVKDKVGREVQNLERSGKLNRKEKIKNRKLHHREGNNFDPLNDEDEDEYDYRRDRDEDDGEVGIQPSQKPDSFHHFILENQYRDLEKSIRGYKEVYVKETREWILKRKDKHCFTDEESEDILRTAQSHLATDIKLGRIKPEVFGEYMNALYRQISFVFESMAEYRYGRYGDYEQQYQMKVQNLKIFLELWTRIQANYSRSIGGAENIATHNSVKGQESLQSSDKDHFKQRAY